jgi:hypothetical protein
VVVAITHPLRLCVGLLAAGLAACSGIDSSDQDLTAAKGVPRLTVNDVSFLYPLPERGEGSLLLPMRFESAGGESVLLPEHVMAMLGDDSKSPYPFLFEAPGRERAWEMLRVTSMRVDPCFEAPDLEHATDCKRQVRLSAQVVTPTSDDPEDAEYSVSDAAVHLFYELDDEAFVSLLLDLRELTLQKSFGGKKPPLGVHPVMAKEGLDGPFARRLNEIVAENCLESSLVRMTFMATGRSGNNWFWGVLERGAGGDFAPGTVVGVDGPSDGFTQMGSDENPDGIASAATAAPTFPADLLRGESIDALSADAFEAAVDRLRALENPAAHSSADVNCASCHLAPSTLRLATRRRGLDAPPESPSSYQPPAGQNGKVPGMAAFGSRNMHAFSYFGDAPAVSPRVVNESARVADYLSSQAFADALPSKLRKKWLAGN